MRARVAEITDVSVFDYRDEVTVELVGRDVDGEVTVVSYVFDARNGDTLQPRESVEDDHAEAIEEALSDAGYAVAGLSE